MTAGNNLGTSPVVIKDQLSFFRALQEVVAGKKITKVDWHNKEVYGFMENSILKIRRDGVTHNWIISEGDIVGTDYIII